VIGSGIMAQRLAGGNGALALLCNTLPTGAILTVLILIFGPVSGAHFNPAVSVAFALRGELPWPMAFVYVAVQLCGAVIGVWAAHLMFELPVWQFSSTIRTGSMARRGSRYVWSFANDLWLRERRLRSRTPWASTLRPLIGLLRQPHLRILR
jgi:glycerol uptake facilitator-like aquaporin